MTHWDEIVAWLSKNAPRSASAIRPPRSPEAVEQAMRTTGVRWPQAVIDFYSMSDGTQRTPAGHLFPGFRPLSLDEVLSWRETLTTQEPREAQGRRGDGSHPTLDLSTYEGRQEHLRRIAGGRGRRAGSPRTGPTELRTPRRSPRSLLPIAEDQSGSFLIVDVRSGPRHGEVLIFDKVEGDGPGTRWADLASLVASVRHALLSGQPAHPSRLKPSAVDGEVDWQP